MVDILESLLSDMMDDDFDDDMDDDEEEDTSASTGAGAAQVSGKDRDAAEARSRAAKRAKQLGFAPQKEVVYNKLLPYGGEGGQDLDRESAEWFARIKANLARSVALGDVRPGFVTWVSRLCKWVSNLAFIQYAISIVCFSAGTCASTASSSPRATTWRWCTCSSRSARSPTWSPGW
jgi:hypothetical protein